MAQLSVLTWEYGSTVHHAGKCRTNPGRGEMIVGPLFSVTLEGTLMDGSENACDASLPNHEPVALPLLLALQFATGVFAVGVSSDMRGLGVART